MCYIEVFCLFLNLVQRYGHFTDPEIPLMRYKHTINE